MEPGRTYRVIDRLGEGAFGSVFLAEATGGGITRNVAIKVPHPDRAGSPELVGRLRDEARMLAMVRHRAIVRLDDLVELDGVWSVVMEYVEGADVAVLLNEGPLPIRAALAVAEEVANALHVAWTQAGPEGRPLHLLHRDIKPSNIRVTPSGEVKLLDFGVARAEFDAREADATQSVFGTPTYLAPERYHGDDSPAGDIYALGVTLFEMLTGVPPGKSAMDADRQPPGRRWAEQWAWLGTVSPALKAQVARMLATDPAARPSARDCARALADLRGAMAGETLEDWAERIVTEHARAKRLGTDRSGSLLIERSSTSSTPRRGVSWLLAGGAVLLVGGVVAAAVAAAGAALYATSGAAPPAAPASVQAPPAPVVVAPPPVEPAPAVVTPPPVEPEPAVLAPPPPPEAAPAAAPPAPASKPAPATATTSPAKAPATSKPPKADPPPAAAPAGSGTLVISGDVKAYTLSTGARAGNLPAGALTAHVTLTNGTELDVDGITVREGQTTTVKCSATFGRCAVK